MLHRETSLSNGRILNSTPFNRCATGQDPAVWRTYDATELAGSQRHSRAILVDQGTSDNFLAEQLHPEIFAEACRRSGQAFELRMHAGYDHGYYFIQTFMEEHLRRHAARL